MQMFLGDLRYGARLLLRSRAFTLVAVTALAIGIGANLSIFGFASALLVRPPTGIANPGRLAVYTNRFSNTAYADYEAYRDRNRSFLALAAIPRRVGEHSQRRRAGTTERVRRQWQLFATLGCLRLAVPSASTTIGPARPARWS